MSTVTPAKSPNSDLTINELINQLEAPSVLPTEGTNSSLTSISGDQLLTLITLLRQQQTAIATRTQQATSSGQSLPPDRHSIPTRKPPEYYNNAKYEDIISKPIKLLYNGSSEQLIPFLNRLDI
jgi:hypothetical protein